MDYEQIKDFIQNRMRMSHVYQPVMLATILEHDGKCSTTDIARAILDRDQSQIEYYENIVGNMVGQVLRRHGIVKKEGRDYLLDVDKKLSPEQIASLAGLCESKIDEYTTKRGERIWQHRKLASGDISGSIKYIVLKNAHFHCELCGVSADMRALEVDHILLRNHGGTDDLSNLQALCYSCNSMKRDTDDTDFRKVRESFKHREPSCAFCEIPPERIIFETELAYAIRDVYPVTALHTLIIPKRHSPDYFALGRSETNGCGELILKAKRDIEEKDQNVCGFNIGINNGEAAGQTVFHCHMHLIPRRKGDVANPRGGVRRVIPRPETSLTSAPETLP
jgi:ATP adenylyltransferase